MSEKIITDFQGNPIGRLRTEGSKTYVSDFQGNPLGTADDNGTRDFQGNPISPQNVPGILLGKKK